MRRKFLTWLLLLVCATFVVTGGLAYLQFDRQVQQRAEQILHTRLNDLAELISYSNDNMQHVVEINNESTLNRTRAVAEILLLNPQIVNNPEKLQQICNEVGADQLCISNEQGIIIAAAPQMLVGVDLKTHDQSRDFLKCINTPGEELIQRPRKNAHRGDIIQYAGVSRRDAPGIVQLGFRFLHEQAVRQNIAFAALANRFKLGENGHIIAFKGGALINGEELSYPTSDLLALPIDKTVQATIGDTEYYSYAIEKNGIRIIGLLPAQEINRISLESLKQLFISNIWLFIVMFLLVWVLLQKLVLNGISRINYSLRRITEGYKDERINVRNTPEFTRLSTGINTMVDAMQSYVEQRKERLQKEYALARSVQNTVLPQKFPAFPDRKSFDIYATRVQSENVGGDFYDFFMADQEHLCFMLGDVSTEGIPGALFMMRAISVIRSLAATGMPPAELMTEANRTLCENNVSKTRLSLFLARLNINTGMVRFINAGTPQALRSTASSGFGMLPMRSGTVLGAHNKSIYRECIVQLLPGERIFLYSQGLLKSEDSKGHRFGVAGLQQSLENPADSVTELIRNIQVDLRRFTGNKEQATDSTLLAVEYKGKWMQQKNFTLTTAAAEAEIAEMQADLTTMLESVLASPVAMTELQQALLAIISALPPGNRLSVSFFCNEETAELILRYNTEQLNPLEQLPPLPLDECRYSSAPSVGSTLNIRKSLA